MPPSNQDEYLADPSPATPDAQTAASSSGTDEQTSASSTGTDNSPSEPSSMADAISAAFDHATTKPTGTDADGDTDTDADNEDQPPEGAKASDADTDADATKPAGEEPDPNAASEDVPDPSQEELAAMKPSLRRRFNQLFEQRRGLRNEVTTLKPDASSYRTLRQFMAMNDLSDPMVADLLKFGADLRSGDPVRLKAVAERVAPILRMAQEATGEIVPADLASRVDTGDMTEEAAKEFARVRHQAALAEARATQASQQMDRQAVTQTQQGVHKAVLDWHTQTRATDPDFDLKVGVMQRVAQALVAERGLPRNPAEAVEYSKLAYQEATKLALQMQPQRAATRPTPSTSTTSPSRSGVRAQPQSLSDAIGQAFDTAIRG